MASSPRSSPRFSRGSDVYSLHMGLLHESCLAAVLSFLPVKDLSNARLVSQQWRKTADPLVQVGDLPVHYAHAPSENA